MNILQIIALAGLFGCAFALIQNNYRYRKSLVGNKITIEEFKNLDKTNVEVVFIGDFGSYQKLNSTHVRFMEYVDARALLKDPMSRKLSFDKTKELIIFSENYTIGYALHSYLKNENINYSYLGKFKEVFEKIDFGKELGSNEGESIYEV